MGAVKGLYNLSSELGKEVTKAEFVSRIHLKVAFGL